MYFLKKKTDFCPTFCHFYSWYKKNTSKFWIFRRASYQSMYEMVPNTLTCDRLKQYLILYNKLNFMCIMLITPNMMSTFRYLPSSFTFLLIHCPCMLFVERQAQHRPDRLKKPRTGSVGTDRLGRGPSRLGPIG